MVRLARRRLTIVADEVGATSPSEARQLNSWGDDDDSVSSSDSSVGEGAEGRRRAGGRGYRDDVE